jgi:carboxyl-terminal processing protease
MEQKPTRIILLSGLAVLILLITFSSGTVLGYSANKLAPSLNLPFLAPVSAKSPASASNGGSTNLDQLFTPFWETWKIVHDQYVDQPVDDLTLMRGAIRGMLDSLGDPHTSYMDPIQYNEQQAPLSGAYEGIGAYVDVTGKYLTIIGPMPGSPAEQAGLKKGDNVIAVDKKDVTGMDGQLVLNRILGPAGTKVTLTIQREGVKDPFDVSMTRAKINLPSIQGKMLDNNIAYIQLSTFGQSTDAEFRKALQPLLDKKPAGLILDLRYDGGGYLQTAIQIVSEFIPADKVALYEQYGDGNMQTYKTTGAGLATDIPLVVLVNEGTASASEITAGAIQDYGRGKLVGVTTYGKGSVQNWIPLNNNAGAVRVTIAHWLTPEKRQINKIGLKPDVEVKISDDDIKNKLDPQLDAAVKLLLNK